MNKVILIGRLGRDPELRYTQSNQAVANFSLATDEGYTKDGKRVDKTEWHNIVVWGRQAENCEKYISKGRLVCVEGRLQTREWEKDGATRRTTEIVAQNVKFLESGKMQRENPRDTKPLDKPYSGGFDDGEIPF